MVHAGVFRNVATAGIKPLKQQRSQHHPRPEHGVRVGSVLRPQGPKAQQQAQKVNGIDAGKARLPEAFAIQFPVARPLVVVIAKHKS